jgi:hypothetical protein
MDTHYAGGQPCVGLGGLIATSRSTDTNRADGLERRSPRQTPCGHLTAMYDGATPLFSSCKHVAVRRVNETAVLA